jgi:hypothetical protein
VHPSGVLDRAERAGHGVKVKRMLLLAVLVTACSGTPAPTPSRTLGPGERWLPVADMPEVCAGTGLDGVTLHGSPDDSRVTWVEFAGHSRREIAWPLGFSARFNPALEVLDGRGHVIATEGTQVVGQCPTRDSKIMLVTEMEYPLPTPSIEASAAT